MKRKLLIILMALGLLALLPATALADDIFASGEGTADDPFVIETVEQLAAFRDSVNSGKTYAKQYIELVDGRIYDLSDLGKEWTPIGQSPSTPFSGHFDGKGANIDNMTMTNTNSKNNDIYYGFFGIVSGTKNENYTAASDIFNAATGDLDKTAVAEENYSAVVKNLTLTNVDINTDGSWVGGLAGGSYNAYFANIYVDNGTIIGTNSVGGVLGRGYATVLDNVYAGMGGGGLAVGNGNNSTGSIYNIGGIAGSLRYYYGGLCAVLESQNYADVDSLLSGGGIGGIVGQLGSDKSGNGPIVIAYCNNYGDITIKDSSHSSPRVCDRVAGGIGGQMMGTTDNVIAYCENHGNITAEVTNPAGALAGIANYYNGLIYQCANFGDISGNAYYSAGLVGHGGEVIVVDSVNNGYISTSLDSGYTSTIIAGVSTATYQDMAFANVDELANALIKAAKTANELTDTEAKLTLINITVADNSGTLELPQFLGELTADSKLCENIIIGDRTVSAPSPYQNNINVTLDIPDAVVNLPEGKSINGTLTLSGDNMSLVNEGTINNLMLNGNDLEAVNLNTITASAKISGDNVVFYNGTAENTGAKLQHFETTAKNTIAYNYGTIDRGTAGGHALQFGNPQTPGTTAAFHNYGTVIGGGSGNSSDYIIYAPRFDNVKVVNYAGSTMQKGGHWFITYGSDEAPDTTGSFAGNKGVFIFQYAEDTVKENDSSIVNDINENNFVGRNNTDLDLRIIKIETVADPVAAVNGVPFADLASAFNSAGIGETVTILADVTLNAPLNITGKEDLTIAGANGATITTSHNDKEVFTGTPSGDFTIQDLTFTNAVITINGAAGVVTVDGCIFQDTQSPYSTKLGVLNLISCQNGSSLVVKDSVFTNLTKGTGDEFVGVYTLGTLESISVTGSTFSDIAGTALSLRGTDTMTITGNTFENWANGSANGEGRVVRADFTNTDSQNFVFNNNKLIIDRETTDSYVKITQIDDVEDTVIDVDKNYWAGKDPVDDEANTGIPVLEIALASRGDDEPLTAEELKDSELVTGQDQYYTEPEMRPSDLNTYVPSTPTYRPIIDDTDNGTVSVRPSRPERGDEVTITVVPDPGYVVDEVSVVDRDGDKVDVTANTNGTYSFIQPRGSVTISVTFRLDICDGGRDCPSYGFIDVDQNLWYHEAVDYVIEHQVMNGTSATTFAPTGTLSRAMLVQILYNSEGRPSLDDEILGYPYADVPGDAWFADAVYWARLNNVVLGYGDENFGPNDPITREQLMTILYRYEQLQGGGFTGDWAFNLDFNDADQVSDWAYEATCWCTMNGVVTGYGNDMLLPQGTATRAEVAQMIMRFLELERN